MKEIHVCLAHGLDSGLVAAIFRNSTFRIRFVRYSDVVYLLVISLSTMKFCKNRGRSNGQEGRYFFLIALLGADCGDCGLGDSWSVTIAGAWTVAKSTAGLEHSCNRGWRCCYFSVCSRWQRCGCGGRTYLRSSAVRGWLRWSLRWPVWLENDQR